MRVPKGLWMIGLVVFIVGCARQQSSKNTAPQVMSKATYDKIQLGMTPDQVVAVAGQPKSKGSPGNTQSGGGAEAAAAENWMYGKVMIMFNNGAVTNKMGH